MWQRLIRFVKHRWQNDNAAQKAIPPAVLNKLTTAIANSESGHSGEIRIYIEAALPTSYLWQDCPIEQIIHQRALSMFGKLGVWDTEHNNGVLIYLLLVEKRLEIVADRGLNDRVPAGIWSELASSMCETFKMGNYEAGLNLAVQEVSCLLQQHFAMSPHQINLNELPNEPVLG